MNCGSGRNSNNYDDTNICFIKIDFCHFQIIDNNAYLDVNVLKKLELYLNHKTNIRKILFPLFTSKKTINSSNLNNKNDLRLLDKCLNLVTCEQLKYAFHYNIIQRNNISFLLYVINYIFVNELYINNNNNMWNICITIINNINKSSLSSIFMWTYNYNKKNIINDMIYCDATILTIFIEYFYNNYKLSTETTLMNVNIISIYLYLCKYSKIILSNVIDKMDELNLIYKKT